MEEHPLILVIDDDANFREIFSSKLVASGFRVEIAQNGGEGIEKMKVLHPDLVLLDMRMPGQSGADVFANITNDPTIKNTRVVFLSNAGNADTLSTEANKKFSEDIGAKGYIYKTDDLDVIIDHVRSFLSEGDAIDRGGMIAP
jgi:CheY-like chemotaxis protein